MATVLQESCEATYRCARPVVSFDEARALAEEYGTPLLVASKSVLVRNYEALRANLPGVEFFYAAKANPDAFILQTLAEIGASVDVCTHREAVAALNAGFLPESIIHTHPCKMVPDLIDCYAEGIRWFTFDTAHELAKFVKHAPDAKLLLRLAVTSHSSVIDLSAKFGADPQDALDLLKTAERLGLHVAGISFHVGSQCICPDDFASALWQVRRIWDRALALGMPLQVLDIGGGLPAPYRTDVLTLEQYCHELSQSLESIFGDLPVRIIAEPGRAICAEAVTLITSVIGKSVRKGIKWYIIDDGLYGSFSGKLYDHADFPLVAEERFSPSRQPCVVAGPTCDSTDVVARDQVLPELEIGELLLVPTMGAYTSASASGFNGLDLTRTIGID